MCILEHDWDREVSISMLYTTIHSPAGHQTKALLNNSGPRVKRSKLEKDINVEVFFQLALLLVICLIGAIGTL